MKIDGRLLAQKLLEDLTKKVSDLKKNGISPHLAVILVGDDPASEAYVRQKKLKGESIGIKVSVCEYPKNTTEEELLTKVKEFNNDPDTHGVIIQQPLPRHINPHALVEATDPEKDVDGFNSRSKFTPPIAEAAIEILQNAHSLKKQSDNSTIGQFNNWLRPQRVAVIGKGETGGKPIINKLRSLGVQPLIIDSKTKDPKQITKNADIIISCVGKNEVLKNENIKSGSILLSIGMFRGNDNKLHGDYDEDDIKDKAGYYTPVPGGVGPVNVAMLLKNAINASRNSH